MSDLRKGSSIGHVQAVVSVDRHIGNRQFAFAAAGGGRSSLGRIASWPYRSSRRWNSTFRRSAGEPSANAATAPSAAAPVLAAPAQFLSAWGTADAKPQLAYKLPPGDITWNLPDSLRGKPQIESREQIAIAVERGRLHETWLADLTVLRRPVFQIQVPAPPQWLVEEALLRQDGSPDQPIRWARAPDGGLTLFLPGPAPEHSQLLLRGSMPYADRHSRRLAARAARCAVLRRPKVASQSILLFRGADVQVAVADPAGMQQSAQAGIATAVDQAVADGLLGPLALGHLRPAGRFVGPARPLAASPAIRIAANSPACRRQGNDDRSRGSTTPGTPRSIWICKFPAACSTGCGSICRRNGPSRRKSLRPRRANDRRARRKSPAIGAAAGRALERHRAAASERTDRSRPSGQRVRVPDVRPLGVAQLHGDTFCCRPDPATKI